MNKELCIKVGKWNKSKQFLLGINVDKYDSGYLHEKLSGKINASTLRPNT
jgi:hypothetical protein